MRSVFTYLGFLTLGIVLGILGFGFVRSSQGQSVLGSSLGLLAGLGLGGGLLVVFIRIWIARQVESWGNGRAAKMYTDIIAAAENPEELPTLLKSNRDKAADLGKLALGFVLANQSIAYIAMALGGLVSIATLLTAYVQIERMEQQNALIETQNSLAEASRRASLNFEMTAILDQIMAVQAETDPDIRQERERLLVARAAAFSRVLKPYRVLDEDGILSRPLSPERGQLLIALEAAGISIQSVIDAGAVFKNADLSGAQIELEGSWSEDNDQDGELSTLDLGGASLIGALFDAKHIEHIDLTNADLQDADLFFVNVSAVDFREAVLPEPNHFGTSSVADWILGGAQATSEYWLRDMVYHRATEGDVADGSNLLGVSADAERLAEPGRESVPFGRARTHGDGLVLSQPLDQPDPNIWLRAYIPRDDYQNLLRYRTYQYQDKAFIGITDQTVSNFDLEMTLQHIPDFVLDRWNESVDDVVLGSTVRELGPGVRILGDPLRTLLFEQFMAQGRNFPRNANFSGVFPGGADVDPIRWRPTSSADPDLTGAKFNHADLRYVDFASAILAEADFSYALMPEWPMFKDASFSSARFINARVPKSWPLDQIDALGLTPTEICETIGDPLDIFFDVDPVEKCYWQLKSMETQQ